MTSAALVDMHGVGKHYGDHVVLQNIDLEIEPRRIVTLIGPNGAGKTTLVKVLLGLTSPDTGSIHRSKDLRVGYMPQKLHIEPTLPLSVGRFLQIVERDKTACLQALERTGIGHLFKRPVQGLSGGETQRMLLARALLRRPNLLVLDEPVQGVDVTGQEALYRLIASLRQEFGCAIFMVSHNLHLVMAATDEVVCLNGHVCCSGTPNQVSTDPAFVALFGEKTAFYVHDHDHHHDIEHVPATGQSAPSRRAGDGHHV